MFNDFIDFEDAVTHVQSKLPKKPKVAVILGSGLGEAVPVLGNKVELAYSEIPDFPKPKGHIEGHKGVLQYGELQDGTPVLMMMGRVHYYEGFTPQEVVFPIRLLNQLGIETLIVTNAAGGVHADYQAGSFMVIADHLNLTGMNPLLGPNDGTFGPRFPDMSTCYARHLQDLAADAAEAISLTFHRGVYAALSGPSYETPAEIRMLRTLGADAVGMSTVPEVIAARHANMQVLGISMISNPAAGVVKGHVLSHQEVIESGQKAALKLKDWLQEILNRLSKEKSGFINGC